MGRITRWSSELRLIHAKSEIGASQFQITYQNFCLALYIQQCFISNIHIYIYTCFTCFKAYYIIYSNFINDILYHRIVDEIRGKLKRVQMHFLAILSQCSQLGSAMKSYEEQRVLRNAFGKRKWSFGGLKFTLAEFTSTYRRRTIQEENSQDEWIDMYQRKYS